MPKYNELKQELERRTDMEIQNAVIERATIEIEDHGILTAWLHLDFGGTGQGFVGGRALYLPKGFTHHKIASPAGHFIYRVMEVAGVEKWEALPGKTIRVRKDSFMGPILAIGHIVKDDWFYPKADFAGRQN